MFIVLVNIWDKFFDKGVNISRVFDFDKRERFVISIKNFFEIFFCDILFYFGEYYMVVLFLKYDLNIFKKIYIVFEEFLIIYNR